jgi:RimJ/RimL family protein N-acetyltransferase
MKTAILYGDGVRLRPIEEKDAVILAEFAKNPAMAPNLAFFSQRPPTVEEEIQWIRTMRKSMEENGPDWVFAIECLPDHAFIGTVGLHKIDRKNHNARIGILIANKDFRGQGYAGKILTLLYDYAFGVLGLRKVYMSFRVDNEKQMHLAEKLGYRKVGILKDEYFWKGQYLDFVRYELLAKDWLEGGAQ